MGCGREGESHDQANEKQHLASLHVNVGKSQLLKHAPIALRKVEVATVGIKPRCCIRRGLRKKKATRR
jgi:hypothetical protein